MLEKWHVYIIKQLKMVFLSLYNKVDKRYKLLMKYTAAFPSFKSEVPNHLGNSA